MEVWLKTMKPPLCDRDIIDLFLLESQEKFSYKLQIFRLSIENLGVTMYPGLTRELFYIGLGVSEPLQEAEG